MLHEDAAAPLLSPSSDLDILNRRKAGVTSLDFPFKM